MLLIGRQRCPPRSRSAVGHVPAPAAHNHDTAPGGYEIPCAPPGNRESHFGIARLPRFLPGLGHNADNASAAAHSRRTIELLPPQIVLSGHSAKSKEIKAEPIGMGETDKVDHPVRVPIPFVATMAGVDNEPK